MGGRRLGWGCWEDGDGRFGMGMLGVGSAVSSLYGQKVWGERGVWYSGCWEESDEG